MKPKIRLPWKASPKTKVRVASTPPPKPPPGADIRKEIELPDHEDRSLEEAQSELLSKIKKGSRCLCCGQFSKRYKYVFSANMCKYLFLLSEENKKKPGLFFHVTDLPKKILTSRDFLRSSYYQLIEEAENADTKKKKRSGLWRITAQGQRFVDRSLAVYKYVVVYNEDVLRFEGPQQFIDDCDEEYFSYYETMNR